MFQPRHTSGVTVSHPQLLEPAGAGGWPSRVLGLVGASRVVPVGLRRTDAIGAAITAPPSSDSRAGPNPQSGSSEAPASKLWWSSFAPLPSVAELPGEPPPARTVRRTHHAQPQLDGRVPPPLERSGRRSLRPAAASSTASPAPVLLTRLGRHEPGSTRRPCWARSSSPLEVSRSLTTGRVPASDRPKDGKIRRLGGQFNVGRPPTVQSDQFVIELDGTKVKELRFRVSQVMQPAPVFE
jgi:hypothetical protein